MTSKRGILGLVGAALLGLAACQVGGSPRLREPGDVRLATYNVQWFSENANPGRVAHLRSVLAHLQADVVGFQEIESKAALSQLLDSSWQVGMADDPAEHQELAIAVRAPFQLAGSELVFTGEALDAFFPGKRDVLRAVVQTPEGAAIVVYVVHMKSRRGGRHSTDPQREGACGLLAAYVASKGDEQNVVVLGDFNDCPRDRSLNILETGDTLAKAGPDSPRLLYNLCESLADRDFVTEGAYHLPPGQREKALAPGANADNDRLRGQDYDFPAAAKVPQSLFDQILVCPQMARSVKSVTVYAGEDATSGSPGRTRVEGDRVEYTQKGDLASDHLPVVAEFKFPR